MAKILSIETSTGVCSVAYSENGKVVESKELYQVNSHATNLTLLIEELFELGETPDIKDIDAVAVSSGPGSYTGLRIGVSTAKGICYALNKPLIAIDSMHIMSQPIIAQHQASGSLSPVFCPLMDARRMEVYTAVFDRQLNILEAISAKIVDETTFEEWLNQYQVVFFGNGAEKCKEVIQHENAVFLDDCHPLAKNLAPLAEQYFAQEKFEDVAYFEPFYLKDFVATTPKKKIL
ncbi:tRNA (adenosine(37)-N6)-threonylcarbamoyltransferase complex dimerization subunit type 1 TsaB [Carboxylicivirga sediminis]|uniref:tRNA (Adenosine(37)-N6)-threonylcarbamoyltransferase complex dimerization subunit type 1 TsaB n=1 Tax=Carboxylicivirga sediminis TaxID=2006564 RepID=A0A941F964_9BACT|nr:tRNA (adenosine(37)-N6)-threonylcarbamoyltransferase complex dimerization subunit type 1 TsaB [Carboxylicivirga sediminis]MBR8537863.1 tRNA (adenosine(37)-N6)-threonylcarbamoyltransferase complex dimerization subunit type 1 TsaB [Carboxylicivirga sediminis]